MKKIIFMMMLMLITIPVYAASNNSFYYDDEKVSDMWITKVNDEQTRSANPYILKRVSDKAYVYCLEAFVLMNNGVPYTETSDYTKYGLTKSEIDKINLIIYYGYGYGKHTSKKWYGVTQYLIWKITDKDAKIYFTDEQWGSKKDLYTSEIDEIKQLINEHNKEPNFIKDYTISTNSILNIDSNIDLSNYNISSDAKYEINNNKLIFKNLDVGEYKVKLIHKDNRYKNNFILYYNKDSQNIIIPGHSPIFSKEYEFSIKVEEGTVRFNKTDSKTKEKLSGATYGIYSNNELIKSITTSDKIVETNLPFGNYIVKEISAPKGYELDTNEYSIVIDENNLSVDLELYDNEILVKVNISKTSTYNNKKLKGATYGIYKDNKLITKITTDKNGDATTKLPYGKYVLKELVAPPGYKLDSKEYSFIIENNLDIKFNLKDDKVVVKVPDTGIKTNNMSYTFIIVGVIGLIYGKTKYNMY